MKGDGEAGLINGGASQSRIDDQMRSQQLQCDFSCRPLTWNEKKNNKDGRGHSIPYICFLLWLICYGKRRKSSASPTILTWSCTKTSAICTSAIIHLHLLAKYAHAPENKEKDKSENSIRKELWLDFPLTLYNEKARIIQMNLLWTHCCHYWIHPSPPSFDHFSSFPGDNHIKPR